MYYIVNDSVLFFKEPLNVDLYPDAILLQYDQILFYHNNPAASTDEILNCELSTVVISIDQLKASKLNELYLYDTSSSVNEFFVNGEPFWFGRDLRSSLMANITSCETLGIDTASIVFGNESIVFSLPVVRAKKLLSSIEVYAGKCFNMTRLHEIRIKAFTTAEEIDSYNFKDGYPEKLHFDL